MFHFRTALLALVLPLTFIACGERETERGTAIHDDFGNAVVVGQRPQRIVSLNPTTTEILFAIGAGDRLVGRSEYDIFPDSAKRVPSLGLAIRPNVEALIGAHPDLVVLYASADNRPAADRLRQIGVTVVAFKIDSIASFERATRLLGRLTGDSANAETVVDSVAATLARVRTATRTLPHPTVFIHGWDKPIIAITGGSFMSELIDIAGGRNVYESIPAPSATVTLEDVVRRDPDFIMTSPREAARMYSSATWKAVPAVRLGRFLIYDTNLVARPSVQLGAAAVSLAEILHPGSIR